MEYKLPLIEFHQYGADHPDDRLLMFAAPAKVLWGWAGIPRKGWKVRMLYQRWITESRQQEVVSFWDEASTPRDEQPKRFLVGPTAITVAILDEPVIEDGRLVLAYNRPFAPTDPLHQALQASATIVVNRMAPRLNDEEKAILEDPSMWSDEFFQHNYVLESLCQIKAASTDPDSFIKQHAMTDDDIAELVNSLEALCRPALVVDGQHRLYGAANASKAEVILPVVAIPNSPWMEQIYQFVVINERAKKVESSLLTDIFGSSLTPSEQKEIRAQLQAIGAQVDPRIAAVIAARTVESPFYNLVNIRLDGDPPSGPRGFIPEATMRQLIDGGRGARGWRADDEFYTNFIEPTFPERTEWDSWSDGKWRDYWFAFWQEVRDWYNAQDTSAKLWDIEQTNLTKAVTLRLYQRLFIEKAIDRVAGVHASRETLVEVLGEEVADEKLAERIREMAIPSSVDDFRVLVREWFLKDGVPVRVFTYPWVSSLDDSEGQDVLFSELEDAWEGSKPGKTYRARNAKVFTTADR